MSSAPPIEFPRRRVSFALGVAKEHSPRHLRRAALDVVLRATSLALRGEEVACATCDTTAARFMRGRCPTCGAASRQRLIALFLQRELQIAGPRRQRVLHFAPEPGLVKMLSKLPSVDYVPGDLTPDKGHARVDATKIELEPGFDGIITSHVLEHVPDDTTAMAEMLRVLRPGGWAIVLVPVSDRLDQTYEDRSIGSAWGRHVHYGQHDHVRIYTAADVVERLRGAGFDVQERCYAEEVGPEDARRHGLRAVDVMYFCRKPGADPRAAATPSSSAGAPPPARP
jgi:SAM-dependent methyltransferase